WGRGRGWDTRAVVKLAFGEARTKPPPRWAQPLWSRPTASPGARAGPRHTVRSYPYSRDRRAAPPCRGGPRTPEEKRHEPPRSGQEYPDAASTRVAGDRQGAFERRRGVPVIRRPAGSHPPAGRGRRAPRDRVR